MYNVQALLKPCSRSAVTSPFFLTLAQGISRGAVEEGHNTAGEEEIDGASLRPQREKGGSQSPGIPKGSRQVLCLWGCEVGIQPLTVNAGGLWPQEEGQVST